LLQARAYWNDYFINSRLETLRHAQQTAQRAIEKDPTFADAYSLLAQSYSLEATNFQENGARNLALAERAAGKAVALNPHSLEAKMALGAVYGEQGKNADSIRILREAVALAPNSFWAWKQLGYVYHYAGLIDLAEAAFRHGRDLDPTLPQGYWMHGRMLLYQGKAHDAEVEVRQALTRFPDQFKLLTFLGDFLYYQGNTEEAERVLDRAVQLSGIHSGEEPPVISAFVHASRNERDKIDPTVFRYKPEEMVDGDLAEWIGAVYALLGDKQPALAWLRRSVQLGNHNFPWFQRDKNWDRLRGDAEYKRLMLEVEEYWKHYNELFGHPQS
jgi:tetratricopeptide (TPR) repeat protein